MGLKLLIFSSQGWLPWQPTQVFSIVYIQWNTTQPQKRNEIVLSVTTWITPENIILSEMHSTQNVKYSDIIYIWNLKNNITECIRKTETDFQI